MPGTNCVACKSADLGDERFATRRDVFGLTLAPETSSRGLTCIQEVNYALRDAQRIEINSESSYFFS